jgi:hypothetical protein
VVRAQYWISSTGSRTVSYASDVLDERRRSVMRIRVNYGVTTYDIGDTPENREALKEVGEYVSEGRSENLILELADGGTLIVVVGPAIAFAVTYTDI